MLCCFYMLSFCFCSKSRFIYIVYKSAAGYGITLTCPLLTPYLPLVLSLNWYIRLLSAQAHKKSANYQSSIIHTALADRSRLCRDKNCQLCWLGATGQSQLPHSHYFFLSMIIAMTIASFDRAPHSVERLPVLCHKIYFRTGSVVVACSCSGYLF